MGNRVRQSIQPSQVLCIVMGGGGGRGLFPLTRDRAIPAVPLAGHYRLVDVPLSNCLNSGFPRIYILTQFNSASLHRHVSEAYKFDQFTESFVEIRAAQQTPNDCSWYQGTADAVRKNLAHFLSRDFEYAVVLSADQLYRMNFQTVIAQHAETGADVTIACVAVPRREASRSGILQMAEDGRVKRFVEKPTDPAVLESLKLQPDWMERVGLQSTAEDMFLASMGIYVFNRAALEALLDNVHPDFGRDILPQAIQVRRVFGYLFQGYWGDLGSLRSFFEANLDLVSEAPRFSFLDLAAPIFSQPLYLPGAKVNSATLDHALLSGGCIVDQATITESIIGVRTVVGAGSRFDRVVSLGCDYYENSALSAGGGLPPLGIGRNARIENTIIDRNARIGDNVVLSPAGKPQYLDHEHCYIRDGIVIVPRNGVIPHGMVL